VTSVRDLGKNPFFRICISIVAAVSVTLVVLSFVLFVTFEGIITQKTVTLVRANLNQLSESTGQTLSSVEKTLVQAYFDDTLQRFGFNQRPDEADLNRGLDQLEKYRFVSSTIQSMYILNKTTETVYIASDTAASKVQSYAEFFDRGVLSAIKDYRGDRPFLPLSRTLPRGDVTGPRASYDGITLLFYDAVNPPAAGSVLVANLDQALFRDRLGKMEDDAHGTSLIVDDHGLVLSAHPQDEGRWAHDLGDVPGFFPSRPEPGSRTARVGGVPSLVTWTAPDKNGWRYVSVVPVASLVSELDSLRGRMIEVALLVLVIGGGLSALGAWFLYQPIGRTLAKVDRLEEESRQGKGALRERILHRILTQPEAGGLRAPDELELSSFSIELNPVNPCRVVLIKMDGYKALLEQWSGPDLTRVKAALMAAAREAFAKWGPLETLDLEEEKLTVVLTPEVDPGDAAIETALGATRPGPPPFGGCRCRPPGATRATTWATGPSSSGRRSRTPSTGSSWATGA